MHELTPSQFGLAAPLFQHTRYGSLACGTLEGGHPGRVFVNDTAQPTSALVCTRVGYYFLAGCPGDDAFIHWLHRAFTEEFAPKQVQAIEDPQILLFYPSDDWREPLFEIFADRSPIQIIKRLVLAPEVAEKGAAAFRCWKERIPPDFRLARMNAEFFEQHPELTGEPELFWGTVEDFTAKSLGRCLIDDTSGVAASACSAVFVGAGEAEISISTAPEYRRQGLGVITAQAFIEAALKRGLNPVWGCFPENTASTALARSLGFVDDADQPVCFWEWRN